MTTQKVLAVGLWLAALTFAQSEVEIVSYTAREENGFYRVVGEVRNTYKEPLCFVEVEILYLDEKGQPIGVDRFTAKDAGTMSKDQVFAERKVILPGETAPFIRSRDLSKVGGKIHSVKVKASGMRLRSVETTASLSGVSTQAEGSNAWRVKGTYTATGKPARNPAVVAVGYDASGKPVEVSTFYLTSDGTPRGTPLSQADPGKSYPFSLLVSRAGIASVKAFTSWDCE